MFANAFFGGYFADTYFPPGSAFVPPPDQGRQAARRFRHGNMAFVPNKMPVAEPVEYDVDKSRLPQSQHYFAGALLELGVSFEVRPRYDVAADAVVTFSLSSSTLASMEARPAPIVLTLGIRGDGAATLGALQDVVHALEISGSADVRPDLWKDRPVSADEALRALRDIDASDD